MLVVRAAGSPGTACSPGGTPPEGRLVVVARPDTVRHPTGAPGGSRVPSDPALLAPDARLDQVAQLLASGVPAPAERFLTAAKRRRGARRNGPGGPRGMTLRCAQNRALMRGDRRGAPSPEESQTMAKKTTKKPASKKAAKSTKSNATKTTKKAEPVEVAAPVRTKLDLMDAAAKDGAAPTRMTKATTKAPRTATPRDPRLPQAGSTIEKTYKGATLHIEVLDAGFRFDGKDWRSLSALAMAITGAKAINGYLFFGLVKRTPKAAAQGEGK